LKPPAPEPRHFRLSVNSSPLTLILHVNHSYKFAGWIRDLTLDGVEPNPGPIFWGHIVTRVNMLLGADLSGPMTTLLNQIREYFELPLTKPVLPEHMEKFFTDPNNSRHDLKDVILQAIKELMAGMQLSTL
jgi:hypothetical protein